MEGINANHYTTNASCRTKQQSKEISRTVIESRGGGAIAIARGRLFGFDELEKWQALRGRFAAPFSFLEL